jgi:hypothetical protein
VKITYEERLKSGVWFDVFLDEKRQSDVIWVDVELGLVEVYKKDDQGFCPSIIHSGINQNGIATVTKKGNIRLEYHRK